MNNFAEVSALVEAVVERLTDLYIFPERATKAATLLRANLAAGAYDFSVGPDLCDRRSNAARAAHARAHP